MAQQTTGVPDLANQKRKAAKAKLEANPFHPNAMTDAAFEAHLDTLINVVQLKGAVKDIGRMVRELAKVRFT